MKQLFTCIIWVCIIGLASAQSFIENIGSTNSKIKILEAQELIIAGEMDGLIIGVNTNYKRLNFCMQAIAIDENSNIVRNLDIPGTKNDSPLAANLYDGKIYILSKRFETFSTSYTYMRYVIDAETMTLIGEPTEVLEITSKSTSANYSWSARSKDGSLTAIINISTTPKGEKYEATEILFDEEMNIEWQRDYPIYSLSSMFVTDDGEIVTIGRSKGKGPHTLYFSVLNENDIQYLSKQTKLYVYDTYIVSYKDSRILVMGFGTTTDSKNDKEINYFGMSVNVETEESEIHYKGFDNTDNNIFYDTKIGKSAKPITINQISLNKCIATEYGAVGTIQNYLYKSSIGILVFALDNHGNIIWKRDIRFNMKRSNGEVRSGFTIAAKGSNVYLTMSEDPKSPKQYTIEEPSRKTNTSMGAKALSTYKIDAEGNISKSMESLSKPAILDRRLRKVGDKHIGFLTNQSGAAIIKFNY